jgi:beta-glucosidase
MEYAEGVFVGHRWYDARRIEPRFAFGHGLSYTTFEYGDVELELDDGDIVAAVEVRNTGSRPGTEVVQVYVRDGEASVRRPVRELKGFAKIAIEPGDAAVVRVRLDERAFSFWDPDERAWRVEPGGFQIAVGRSSRDLRTSVGLTIDAGEGDDR